jgi:hypothetical protein
MKSFSKQNLDNHEIKSLLHAINYSPASRCWYYEYVKMQILKYLYETISIFSLNLQGNIEIVT